MTPLELTMPSTSTWPTGSLEIVIDVIRNGTQVHIRSFPPSWKQAPEVKVLAYTPAGTQPDKRRGGRGNDNGNGGGGGAGGGGGNGRAGADGNPPRKKIKLE